jgi:peptidoglycan/xylan/chitin deacetylase (PgdA/CDA1 family)
MSKKLSLMGRAKKAAGTFALLAVFLLPLYLGTTWVLGMTGGVDTRPVYTQEELAGLRGSYSENGDLKPFDEAVITITFDDGWESIYSEGFQVLEKYNIKSTQYILGGRFGDKNYLSEKQIKSMQGAGHEIAAHTMTHPNLTALNEKDLEYELSECDVVLSRKFGEMREFATPLGASNDMVLAHAKKYYRSLRNTASDPAEIEDVDINIRDTFDRYDINAYTVRSTTTLEDIQKLIDYTIQRKGWLVLTYHQIEQDNPSEFAVSPFVLDDHLNMVRQSNIRTATMGQVLDALLEREN